MKEFIEWLGVNDKIAKLVVWIFFILIMLIIINAALDSLGFVHYQITYDNLKKISINKIIDEIAACVLCLGNYYCVTLLIFRLKHIKKIFKYSILYLILNWIFTIAFGDAILQIFIFLFYLTFAYLFSGRNKKYILYGFLSVFVNTVIQGITYLYKASLIDYSSVNEVTRVLLFSDYFIIMGIIILVKEIYLKKRSDNNV